MSRFATIDVGTNTVLLLIAERIEGVFSPLVERAEITRLGRGVDRSGRIEPAAIRETVAVLARYAEEARALGAKVAACVATSAARDAANSAEFFEAARAACGIAPEVITGEEEARLVYRSAWIDFGRDGAHLSVLDVGGGSTEYTWGEGRDPLGRRSLQIGAVRLTERVVDSDPIGPAGLARLQAAAAQALHPIAGLGCPSPGARLVAVAGTVTTLAAVEQHLPRYDPERVHGSALSLGQLESLFHQLGALTVAERAGLPGMEPKRADVIVAGCALLVEALRVTGFVKLTVSDRGVRWGLLYDRAGDTA